MYLALLSTFYAVSHCTKTVLFTKGAPRGGGFLAVAPPPPNHSKLKIRKQIL